MEFVLAVEKFESGRVAGDDHVLRREELFQFPSRSKFRFRMLEISIRFWGIFQEFGRVRTADFSSNLLKGNGRTLAVCLTDSKLSGDYSALQLSA